MNSQDQTNTVARTQVPRLAVELIAIVLLGTLVASSAIITKEAVSRTSLDPLVAVAAPEPLTDAPEVSLLTAGFAEENAAVEPVRDPLVEKAAGAAEPAAVEPAPQPSYVDGETRFFNGRPVRPSRTITMVVTAYSPDERSCGDSADGITSSIHNIHTNDGKLVAADSRVLPLGAMITVPGYDNSQVVPVLDRGGAIKGNRLDVLFPTHEAARKWGVRKLQVTVWAYADGRPADDFRAIRDSRN